MEVHRELGCGFLEAVYQEALEIIFDDSHISYKREEQMNIFFKGKPLRKHYIADFICFDSIILEVKALNELTGEHEAQVLNYLKATNFKLGLLINFGTSSLQYKRIIL